MVIRSILFLLILGSIQIQCGDVVLNDLTSFDEQKKIRALYAIAQSGKLPVNGETLIVSLMTKSWEGRRVAKWCLHALIRGGVPADKHIDAFRAASIWVDKRPEKVEDRKKTEPEWRKLMEGPELPEDLKMALPDVWSTVTVAMLQGYDRWDQKTVYKYRDCIQRMSAPGELLIPRLGAILNESKKDVQHRIDAVHCIMILRRNPASVEPLIKGLAAPEPKIRTLCAMALSGLGYEADSYGDVIWEYKHPDAEKSIAALQKLATIDPDAAAKSAAEKAISKIKEGK